MNELTWTYAGPFLPFPYFNIRWYITVLNFDQRQQLLNSSFYTTIEQKELNLALQLEPGNTLVS